MTHPKRFIALALCLALVLALSACGGDTPSAQESENPSGLVWTADYAELSLDSNIQYVNSSVFAGGKLYISAQTYNEETSESGTILAGIDPSTGEASTLPGYTAPSLPEEAEGGSVSVNAIAAGPDGGLWVLEDIFYHFFNLPEGFSGTDEEKYNYSEYRNSAALRLLDSTGAEVLSVDLSSLAGEQDNFYASAMAGDSEGNVYLGDQNGGFYVFAPDGSQLFAAAPGSLGELSYIDKILTLGDGRAALVTYDSATSGNVLRPFDTAAKNFGESIPVPTSGYYMYNGDESHLFYYIEGASMYGFDAATGEGTALFNLVNCGVNVDSLSLFVPTGGEYLCLVSGFGSGPNSEYTFELATLKEVEAASLPQKTTLTLAAQYLGNDLRADVLNFNRSSDKYRIEVTDYSEFNTEDDYTAGLTRLNTEIISGKAPDILVVDGLPVEQYAARGLLEDLYTYLDSDGELSRDSLFQSILSALEIDGKLYTAAPSFNLQTLVGRASVVGSEPGWTVRELMDLYASAPAGTSLLGSTTASSMLYTMMQFNFDQFVDWETATCSFNSQEFIDILNFCAQFPVDFTYDENAPSEPSMIQSGQQLLYTDYISQFTDLQFTKAMFGDDICFKGYPTSSGSGTYASVSGGLAITSTCADKEGAWSFVRQVFTEDYADDHWIFGFPINRAAYDKALKAAMTPQYYTDPETGEQVEMSMGGMGYDDFSVDFYATTQEEADQLAALIENASAAGSYDENIMAIITEECDGLFSGQRTAEQVADVIQNRAGTYIAEQS